MTNIFDNEQAVWSGPHRAPIGIASGMSGRMAEAHTHCFSTSSSRQASTQQTGGTQSGSAAQAVGSGNDVNTGTQTTVNQRNTSTATTASNNRIGNDAVVTFNTGLSADEVATLLGNVVSNAVSGTGGIGGGGGVTIANTPPVSTVQAQSIASVGKWAVWGAIALAAVIAWKVFFRKKKS